MQVPGSDNAGPGSDSLGLELRSEGKETFLDKKKASGIMLGCKLILSEIFSLTHSHLGFPLQELSWWRGGHSYLI